MMVAPFKGGKIGPVYSQGGNQTQIFILGLKGGPKASGWIKSAI